MDPTRFSSDEFGDVRREGVPFWYFEPKPLLRVLALEPETVMVLSQADDALGRLASAGRFLPDPTLFVRPYIRREALASSRIEGTQASLSDVFRAEASGEEARDENVREVLNYIAAVDHGSKLLSRLPVSQRLIRELHRVLMTGVRGHDRGVGRWRRSHVFVGAPADSPETAVFVPPLPPSLPALLTDWERFANEDPRLPVLVQCALLHHQFETIHPFMDGNGRVGRLLVVFFLMAKARLPTPLLYISPYLEERRREYYDRLQAVRERGEIQEWIQFFLHGVTVQAEDAVLRSQSLFDLRERYRAELRGTRSRAAEVVDLLFENPFLTTRRAIAALGITNQGALKLIRSLEGRGWLREIGGFGRGGLTYWLASDVFDTLNTSEAPGREERDLVATRLARSAPARPRRDTQT